MFSSVSVSVRHFTHSVNASVTVFSKLKNRLHTTRVYDLTYSTATKAIVNVAVNPIKAEKSFISILKQIFDVNLSRILASEQHVKKLRSIFS